MLLPFLFNKYSLLLPPMTDSIYYKTLFEPLNEVVYQLRISRAFLFL